MPKYDDGITEAKVGDVVECVKTGIDLLCIGQVYLVTDVTERVWVMVPERGERNYGGENFKLFSRKEQPMPEPLVKWPEEKLLLYDKDVQRGDFFVYIDEPQHVYQKLYNGAGERFVTLVHGEHHIHGHTYQCDGSRVVRRLKMIRPPQFEVI